MNFHDRLAMLGYADYQEYLESQHWRHFRYEFYRQKDGVFCQACGAENGGISLHHKTYERLGCEHFDDVIMLCDDCHDRVHHGYGDDIERATKSLLYDAAADRMINSFARYVRECKRRLT